MGRLYTHGGLVLRDQLAKYHKFFHLFTEMDEDAVKQVLSQLASPTTTDSQYQLGSPTTTDGSYVPSSSSSSSPTNIAWTTNSTNSPLSPITTMAQGLAQAIMVRNNNWIFGVDPSAINNLMTSLPFSPNSVEYWLTVETIMQALYPPVSLSTETLIEMTNKIKGVTDNSLFSIAAILEAFGVQVSKFLLLCKRV